MPTAPRPLTSLRRSPLWSLPTPPTPDKGERPVREYVLTGVLVAAVTYLLTPYALRLAIKTHAFTEVRERDVHTIPTPRLGGLAMFAGICAGLLVASRLPTLHRVFQTTDIPGVLMGGAVLVLLGAADDRWGLDALTKLAG